jgi:hypothetical protein
MDAEEVGGWRASGWRESQPLGGGRYRHRMALGGKRTGRRGGVGKFTACTYLFVAVGRAEKDTEAGRADDERVSGRVSDSGWRVRETGEARFVSKAR